MINAQPHLRAWVVVSTVGAALVVVAGQRAAVNYLARERWEVPSVAGTQFKFTRATVFVFNDTGHAVLVSASAGGKVLFAQRLDAERPPSSAVADVHAYRGKAPYKAITVENYDTLTRKIEITESLFLHRTEIVDLASLPKADPGNLSIRVTRSGFEVKRAKYTFR